MQFVGWFGQEMVDLAAEADILDRMEICGEQSDVKPYYRNADIMFICSRFEGFGCTTVEAMMSGCLVIGTDTAGTGELLTDGKTGLTYTYENVDQLVERIRYALAHKEEMKKIAAAGRDAMSKTMTAENNADQVYNVYCDVLRECKPRTIYHRYIAFLKMYYWRIRVMLRTKFVFPVLNRLLSILK